MIPLMRYQFLRWVGIRGLRQGPSCSLVFGLVQGVITSEVGVLIVEVAEGVEGVNSTGRVNLVDRVDRVPEVSEDKDDDEDEAGGVGVVALAVAARAHSRLSAITRRTERRTPHERVSKALPALGSRFFTRLSLLGSLGALTMLLSGSAILR